MSYPNLRLRAGARAREHIRRNGLAPDDIACIPAAAGGPKGLALIPLDRWLFGEWLPRGTKMPALIGASIGAWRMTAAARRDPVAALDRLADRYIHHQRYPRRVRPDAVADSMRALARTVAEPWQMRAEVPLRIVVSQAIGASAGQTSRRAFARVALDNTRGRPRLARHLRRLVFASGPASPLDALWRDDFATELHPLDQQTGVAALCASGSIPLICAPVHQIPGLPDAHYWDGGLIDYHLYLPYAELPGITLYPHFVDGLIPGWLDKFVPWRKKGFGQGDDALSSMLLVSPSQALRARLPNGKLPDRNDFYRYALDYTARESAWTQAVGECQRLADEFARWVENPDPTIILPL